MQNILKNVVLKIVLQIEMNAQFWTDLVFEKLYGLYCFQTRIGKNKQALNMDTIYG